MEWGELTRLIDITGKKFGRFTVIRRAGYQGKSLTWECSCECGNARVVQGAELRSGRTKSCGCHSANKTKERNTTHGLKNHALYRAWNSMITRCENENRADYHSYGGRGIGICDRWRLDFKNFYDDMIGTYQPGLTLERDDNNVGYCPENCRWIPKEDQPRNRRPSSEWKFKRLRKPLSDQWSGAN